MWYGDGWGHMGAWGWVGMFFMMLFWLGVIALVVLAIGRWHSGISHTRSDEPSADRAPSILRERFARGELTADEYEQMRKILDDTRHSGIGKEASM